MRMHAIIDSFAPDGASINGKITCSEKSIAEIDLIFSHLDHNLAGKKFTEENFVFPNRLYELRSRDLSSAHICSPENSLE